jgi:acetolactate synthase-1/2/3 large subunit
MDGARWLVRELKRRGVPFVSVLCGNGLDPFLAACADEGLLLIDTRNEQAAAYIADAYARLTGQVGVCAVSSAVAHVNGLAGVLNAYYDGAPLLMITGTSPSDVLGRGGFQDLDHTALARPICKHAEFVPQAARLPQAFHHAWAAASSGRAGPVHLTVTLDAWQGEVGDVRPRASAALPATQRAAADQESLGVAADWLRSAERPLLVAGSGLFYGQAGPALQALMDATGLPVVTPIWDRGVVDAPHDAFLGVIGAASGEPDLLGRADLIILAGARVDYRVSYLDSPPLAAGVRVIRIDVDANELQQGAPCDLALLGDPDTVLRQFLTALQEAGLPDYRGWLHAAQMECARFYRGLGRWIERAEPGITGDDIVQAVGQALSANAVFLVDGGNIGQWAHLRLCQHRYPSHWLTCGASGVIGWGVPGAMAARLAYPDRPIVLLSGDGSIGFALIELASAARQGLPFVVVVADDRAWGIVVSGQRRRRGRTVASELGVIDYVRVAEGLGALGVRITMQSEIAPAIRAALSAPKPVLIHVPTQQGGPAD